MRLIYLVLLAALALTACGKKGDLYLPSPSQPASTQSTPAQ